ncbi:MAG: hypothetical protein MUF50_03175 [Planctomycetes bacterium]|nr:hypothetical protein [Planctomycetota bacterium]
MALFFLAVRPFKLFAPVYHYGKNSLGEVYFPLGLILAAFYFLPEQLLAFQFGVLVLSFSDALAAIFGNGLGKNEIRIWGEKKTLLGSFAFFISTCIIAFFLSFPGGNLEWWRVMTASLILTFVEMILAFGLDNLILPILAAQLFVALL